MKLKDKLDLLQGQYVKIGARMSFIYCQICDKNIYETLKVIEKKEYNRICNVLKKTQTTLKNFNDSWEMRIDNRIETLKAQQKTRLEQELKKVGRNYNLSCKDKGRLPDPSKRSALQKEKSKELEKLFKEELKQLKDKCAEDRKQELNVLKNRLNNYESYKKNFQPLLEREVVDFYPSIVEEKTYIIKITGNEIGKYWDKEEYDRDNLKEK